VPESPKTKHRGRKRAVRVPGKEALPLTGTSRPRPDGEIPLVHWADRSVSGPVVTFGEGEPKKRKGKEKKPSRSLAEIRKRWENMRVWPR
jgi:hypothetical protein